MSDFGDALAAQIPRLRRYARALTYDAAWADDLVQDTLERALRRQWLFRLNSNLTAWLFSILYRLYLNGLSRSRAAQALPEDAPEPEAPQDPALRLDIQRALARLSPEHRAVIVLVGLEQLTYKEAAEVLGVPLGTIMSRLTRARDQSRMAPACSTGSTGTMATHCRGTWPRPGCWASRMRSWSSCVPGQTSQTSQTRGLRRGPTHMRRRRAVHSPDQP